MTGWVTTALLAVLLGASPAWAQETISPPVLLLRPALPYPEGHRDGPVTVELLVVVDATGRVESVTGRTGPEPFLGIAIEQAAQLRFSPARDAGVPIAVEVPFTWTFVPPQAPVDVRGWVRSSGPGEPLPGVEIQAGDRTTTTAEDGSFALRGLSPGEIVIEVTDPSWAAEAGRLIVDGDSIAEVTLYASPAYVGEAVGVYRKGAREATVRRIARQNLNDEPGSMGDPIRALQNLPGVVRTPLDAGWLLVRGGGPDDTRVFVDGVSIPLLYHLGGLTSVLHPEMVGSIDLHAGVPPARLGNSLAGAAEVHTARAEDTPRGVAGFNTAFAHVFAETPISSDSGVSLAARRSYLDAVLALALDEDAAAIAPQFWDVAARIHGKRTDAMALAIYDSAVTPGESADEPIILSQTAGQVQLRSEVALGDTVMEIQPWISVERRRLETGIREEHLTSTLPGLRLALRHEADPLSLAAGGVAELRDYVLVRNDAYRRARIVRTDPWAEAQSSLGPIDFRAGIRLETLFVSDQLPRFMLSPRGSATWHATSRLDVTAQAQKSSQAPDLLAAVAFPEGTYLPLEHSDTAALTATFSDASMRLIASVWTRRFQVVGYELDGTLGPLDGRADGLETSLDLALNRTDMRAIVQFSRSQRREDRGDPWIPDLYDQPLRLHLQALHRLPKRWSLGARARYASGFYNVRGVTEAFDLLTQSEVDIPDGRLPAYASLDLRVAKRWDWRTVQLTAYLDLLNASGRRIPEPAINGIDEAVVIYTYGLPVLPLFGVEGSWWRQRRESDTSSK